METTKEPASSTSSPASGLSGRNVSVSSGVVGKSAGPPASLASGRTLVQCDISGTSRKQEAEGQNHDGKKEIADGSNPSCLFSLLNRDSYQAYQPEKIEPCSLSSSLYYGGQDICDQPQSSQTYTDKKDSEDDSGNSNVASRGNWWQGSLYY